MQRLWLGIPLIGCLLVATPAPSTGQELELVGRIPGPATNIHVHDDRAYVSAGATLRIFDLTDPSTPTALGSFRFPQEVRGVRVSGTVAYVAIDFDGLALLDVSDPTTPTPLASVETPGQALGVAVSGTTVVVTNRLSGLEIIDVSDPSTPMAHGSYFAEGYAIDVDASGSFAYVVDTPGGLSIVDLSQPGEVTAEGTHRTTEPSAAVAVTTLQSSTGAVRTIVGLMSSDSLLELFDATDPSSPVAVGNYRDDQRQRPSTDGFAGAAATVGLVRVRMQGDLAFLTDAYPPFRLEVVDVSDPANPTPLTSYEPAGSPQDIAVFGSYILVALRLGRDASEGAPGVIILQLTR